MTTNQHKSIILFVALLAMLTACTKENETGGNTFGNVASTMPNGFEPDPDFQQAANTVSKGIKTAGIIGTVIGAGLVTTGIILVSSDGRSGSRHSGRNRHRRFSENLLAPEQNSTGWVLSLNAGPTGGGLALTF